MYSVFSKVSKCLQSFIKREIVIDKSSNIYIEHLLLFHIHLQAACCAPLKVKGEGWTE